MGRLGQLAGEHCSAPTRGTSYQPCWAARVGLSTAHRAWCTACAACAPGQVLEVLPRHGVGQPVEHQLGVLQRGQPMSGRHGGHEYSRRSVLILGL